MHIRLKVGSAGGVGSGVGGMGGRIAVAPDRRVARPAVHTPSVESRASESQRLATAPHSFVEHDVGLLLKRAMGADTPQCGRQDCDRSDVDAKRSGRILRRQQVVWACCGWPTIRTSALRRCPQPSSPRSGVRSPERILTPGWQAQWGSLPRSCGTSARYCVG